MERNPKDTLVDMLEWGIRQRAELKETADLLVDRLSAANKSIFWAMQQLEIATYTTELGTLTCKQPTTTSSLSRDKLRAAMLGAGLSAEKVAEIVEAATEVRPRAGSIDFRGSKH